MLSRTKESNVSLVRLSLTSLMVVSPIVLESACDVAASGSATGLSRLTWGKRYLIGWVNFSPVNGVTVGDTDEFNTVR